ncbi:MAG TPA: oligosaccharide flippase family protein, partial [Pseudomonadales bacterium]|nr:oligosaccharide flippase family protein [Pseudomonadales bacterium]
MLDSLNLPGLMAKLLDRLLRPGESLKWRTIQGFLVIIFGDAYLHALRLGGNLVMTRLLFPEAFGLMLIVNLVFTALHMLSDAGIAQAVIS